MPSAMLGVGVGFAVPANKTQRNAGLTFFKYMICGLAFGQPTEHAAHYTHAAQGTLPYSRLSITVTE